MLGKKASESKLFYNFSLEKVVPEDDFYRKLEKAVDLSWVPSRVAHFYAKIGRPSIDPEVIIKIELIGYLEGITSERQLMRQIADRLSLRRYIGYDIDEEVPDHSTLSKVRDLLGREVFQEIFDYTVRLCQAAGMVGGVHLSVDKSLMKADASLDSLERRVVDQTPEEFVERLFEENLVGGDESQEGGVVISVTERAGYPERLPLRSEAISDAVGDFVASRESREEEQARGGVGEEGKKKAEGKVKLRNSTHVSRTDGEARLITKPGVPLMLGYSAEIWTDSRAGVVTHADATKATVAEQETVRRGVERQREEFGIALTSVSADKGYGQGRLYRWLRENGVVGYIPHQKLGNGSGVYGVKEFRYDGERGVYICPAGCELKHSYVQVRWPTANHVWLAKDKDCKECQLRGECTKSGQRRELMVSIHHSEYEEMDKRLGGRGARLAAIARQVGPEPHFGWGKEWQGLRRAKYRGLEKVKGQVLLTAAAQNIKKYIKWVWRKTEGAGKMRLVEKEGILQTIDLKFSFPTIFSTQPFQAD